MSKATQLMKGQVGFQTQTSDLYLELSIPRGLELCSKKRHESHLDWKIRNKTALFTDNITVYIEVLRNLTPQSYKNE